MSDDTESEEAATGQTDNRAVTADETSGPSTSGHVERTILHELAGEPGEPVRPTTVGAVSAAVSAVIERGEYGNLGPRSEESVVQKSTIRRAMGNLAEKGLVQRVESNDLPAWVDLGDRVGATDDAGTTSDADSTSDADDVTAFEHVSDDARVTDWVLTEAGRAEVERLDARYEADLDDLAARYGRRRGETTTRVDA